ncbi:hypothetical protein [Comamonas flocculans]|uniref:hypothetical protein n=1 Tax=Comamonas flocculans TaxID=2597701 RepID=UPI0021066359|nr:hypothetical protein [Comamonas flocculans]
MSSHHDYIIEITAQHDALKPFAPENGQPLRVKTGDAMICAVPSLRHWVLQPSTLSAELDFAVVSVAESSLRPDNSA